MTFGTEPSDDGTHTVIRCRGDLDFDHAEAFRQRLAACPARSIVLDFDGVNFVDSTGVGALVHGLRNLEARQVSVRVVNVQPNVYEVFELMGLIEVFGADRFSRCGRPPSEDFSG